MTSQAPFLDCLEYKAEPVVQTCQSKVLLMLEANSSAGERHLLVQMATMKFVSY